MSEIEKLLKEKNDILIDIGLLYIEKLRLEKRLKMSVERIQNIEYSLSKYEYEEDNQ
ncbi:MAG: hypothetical protein II393_01705 [Cytophagales bacterium]|nr:hypothetical protein [Cytophagales bacterium]MBQ5475319.1 hypothetical protein [Lachnospiraceae bacterium]